jgi:hypothetical protein
MLFDQNVLRFGIEYVGKYKNKSNAFIDIESKKLTNKSTELWKENQ